MPLQFNPQICRPKTICCATGQAYDPVDPCSLRNEVFNPATCECEGDGPQPIVCWTGSGGGIGAGPKVIVFNGSSSVPANPIPEEEGIIEFYYNSGSIADQYSASGAISLNTGFVSGSGVVFAPKAEGVTSITVTVEGGPNDPNGFRTSYNFSMVFQCIPN